MIFMILIMIIPLFHDNNYSILLLIYFVGLIEDDDSFTTLEKMMMLCVSPNCYILSIFPSNEAHFYRYLSQRRYGRKTLLLPQESK
jgi:hypothetical protein